MAKEYYKAVPKRYLKDGRNPLTQISWTGIKTKGLDPSYAGRLSGATVIAMAQVGREQTSRDTNQTWLGSFEDATGYAEAWIPDSVILKVVVSDAWARQHIRDAADSGWITNQVIPPDCISVLVDQEQTTFQPLTTHSHEAVEWEEQ